MDQPTLTPADHRVKAYIVDSFSDLPFAGNPAGVVLWDGPWPEDLVMRRVSEELGHETAFARPAATTDHADWELRWFTPGGESNVCGHATLATLHVLRAENPQSLTVRFASGYGILVASAEAEGPITLDFPVATLVEAPVPSGLSAALGIDLRAAVGTGALGDLMVVASSEDELRELRPNFNGVADVIAQNELRGVIVTARANADSSYDFVSRFFMPSTGFPEDAVTGSAHTALAPYWSIQLGRTDLIGKQLSDRSGVVTTAIHGDRVELSGHAVTVMDGFLHFD